MNPTTENPRTETSQFAVRVRNLKANKNEVHYFDTKSQSESFRSGCKPTDYMKPVVYPIALHDKICV